MDVGDIVYQIHQALLPTLPFDPMYQVGARLSSMADLSRQQRDMLESMGEVIVMI